MIELQQLTTAFDPLTAHTEGVRMALIISPSRADLLEAAFSASFLAVYHNHSTPVPHSATSQARCRDMQNFPACRDLLVPDPLLLADQLHAEFF